jgi:hypothetical protein
MVKSPDRPSFTPDPGTAERTMRGCTDVSFESTVRRAFARLTREELPRAAAARGWPVRTPEEFEELLFDHLHDVPGEGRRGDVCLFDLVLAVELGERLLAGSLCCRTMNHRQRKPPTCGKERQRDALEALLVAISRQRDRDA